jgi:hypothetical protein
MSLIYKINHKLISGFVLNKNFPEKLPPNKAGEGYELGVRLVFD